jgi:hypothetical protein
VLTIVDAPCPDVMPDCGERNVGWCYPASGDVYLLSRALLRGPATVTALIRHELAHVALQHRRRLDAGTRNYVTIRRTEREADHRRSGPSKQITASNSIVNSSIQSTVYNRK